ncbi:hypothetical protein CHT23_000762 [Salmonella enterica subsp. houtenae serovar 48:z4,z32:-]|uniref:Uncharacterized protein n=1 Tax=Salmonella enterica subsp. houtenae serovar 48:z4,z32:- TaxID=2577535 RepID=A0A729IYB7_SALHO|nr:hypothetical protein [Salmonella enterica subsp. houtenae]EAN3150404.1 hypothetical protein [Salmonella enterica]EBI0349114.1 hypothetical protein [Salmonella enterica subsp. arizonae serovar 48:z4,z23,z32:-]EDU9325108.1 hypothetical protein [Salmonella enterica subsp. enterica]EDW4111422.1 hypothetical protein [Salmonella enterica subsp. arizonae]EDW5429323.1 hypothetical protein [Salmonella enterica subsp. enterica serovar Djakarta]EEE1665053.1 hypothetical protein [Salmonella enterica s
MLLSGCEAKGAVNDSIEQGGDYSSIADAERRNCFCTENIVSLPRFAFLFKPVVKHRDDYVFTSLK